MSKSCVICGKPSGMYPLCREHLQMKADGKVVKCENCGNWHVVGEPCGCKISEEYTELPTEGFEKCVLCDTETNGYAFCRKCYKKHDEEELLFLLNLRREAGVEKKNSAATEVDLQENSVIVIDNENKFKCITCGRKIDGLLFCSSCFAKYKNKELLFKISNCTNVELLDDSYEGRYTCKDGHIVKSKAEREIDNYLFEHNIQHAYEKDLPYGATDKEILHPDFFLPNYLGKDKHVYIEHWGYNENNIQYTKTKKFKMPIYKKLGITLICTYEKTDSANIDSVLERKLNKNFIKENAINYDE